MPYKHKQDLRDYQRKWVAERRARFFRDKICAKCKTEGTKDNPLELDHIYPELKWSHRIWSYSWKRIMEEAAKCQILCHDCHWAKTQKDMDYKLVHGKLQGYKKYGCRCDECRKAFLDYHRDYRNRRAKDRWPKYYKARDKEESEE